MKYLISIFEGIQPDTYFLMMMVLTILCVFALWRGRETTRSRARKYMTVAVLAFYLSRIIDNAVNVLGYGHYHFAVFSAISILSFLYAALALLELASRSPHDPATEAQDLEQQVKQLSRLPLARQMLYFGFFAGFVYLVRDPASSVPLLAIELCHALLIGGTVGLLAYVFANVVRRIPEAKLGIAVCALVVTASWLLYELPGVTHGWSPAWTASLARILDVVALFLLLGAIASHYTQLAMFYKTKARENRDEMDHAKQELSKVQQIAANIYEDSNDLIKKQKEQTLLYMKKVEGLEKIFEIGITIQRRKQLDELLQMVVELVRENLGFKTVTLRLFNRNTQSFETKAYVGLSDEVRDTVVGYRIPLPEFRKMIEPRFRVSNSYFIRNTNTWYGEDLANDGSVIVEDTWGDIDMLIVPFVDEDNETIGYLSVENPENPQLSVVDVIETIENLSTLAVIAIRNASMFSELERKNEKLRVYADKLSSLNKLKSNFVATISHEFRTPLTSIKAYCDTLIKNADKVDRELLKQFLAVIDEESGRLMTLIEDILDFSQMESGAIKFERRPCSLVELVDEAAKELDRNFKSKQIILHRDVPDDDVTVRGESDLLKQMIINLLHNASKFSKDGGNVWVRLEDGTVTARLVVEDDGIGIPDDQMTKIFEQFHQVDGSESRKHGGSGLGLAICKNIVEWHDGRIWVENVPGSGARFVVALPKKDVVVKCHVLRISSTVRRFEVERFMELLVENVSQMMNARKASIMLLDPDSNELRIEAAIGLDEEIVENARVQLGEGIAGKVAQDGQSLLVSNIEEDKRIARSNNDLVYVSKSFLAVPIMSRGEVIGVVNIASPITKRVFDIDDQVLLEALVKRLSVAISKLQAFADTSFRYEQVRETFKAILEQRRYVDSNNEDLVAKLVALAAERMGLDEEAAMTLHYVMNIYDLGLSKIGYHIIKKPKDLTPKDREEIEKHTVTGSRMLQVIESVPLIKDAVMHHHENFDGSGYPDGLKGTDIPPAARILRVADSLKALISQRPYQKQYSLDEAVEVIKHRSGSFFDPDVVDCFAEAIEDYQREKAGEGLAEDESERTPN